jgi:hypothetical protein
LFFSIVHASASVACFDYYETLKKKMNQTNLLLHNEIIGRRLTDRDKNDLSRIGSDRETNSNAE